MSISYELAKELKDAGFPQSVNVLGNGHYDVYVPTLSELIHECGKGVLHFDYTDGMDFVVIRDDEKYFGNTPEEAVARLYIALHNK